MAWSTDPIAEFAKAGGRGIRVAKSLGKTVENRASDLVMSAVQLIGVPYRWGGTSIEEGFDCSGFVRHVFESTVGLVLPRTAAEQAKTQALMKVDKEELEPGDLVFFKTTRKAFSHVGLYIGEGKFVHAPRAGADIRMETMNSGYWTKRFSGARRAQQK